MGGVGVVIKEKPTYYQENPENKLNTIGR